MARVLELRLIHLVKPNLFELSLAKKHSMEDSVAHCQNNGIKSSLKETNKNPSKTNVLLQVCSISNLIKMV